MASRDRTRPVVWRKLAPLILLTATACAGAGIVVEPGERPENAFVTQVVEHGGSAGVGLWLAADADGNPHLSYLVLPEKAVQGEEAPQPAAGQPVPPLVRHAHFAEGAWTRNEVATEQGSDADGETAISVDDEGVHHVAWTTPDAVLYSSNAGGSFAEPDTVTRAKAQGLSVTTDGDGAPWLAFYVVSADPEAGTDIVRVATPAGDAWTVETAAEASLPTSDSEATVGTTGIGVGPDGPVVAYGSEGQTFLARDTGPLWESEVADGNGGFGVSLAVDGDGNPHLSYLNADGQVRHAHSVDGAAWETSQVGEGLLDGVTSIAVDGDGIHYVAWQQESGAVLASNEGGEFAPVDVPGTEGGARPRVAVGADNAPMVAWSMAGATGVKLSIRGIEDPLLAVPPGGGGQPTTGPTDGGNGGPPPCEPSGPELAVTAKDISFDTDCLAAPAGEAFAIAFDNQDSVPHNVAIYTEQGGEPLFQGEVFPGPAQQTYDVDPLEEGQYYFQCDVHPNMNGTFVSA